MKAVVSERSFALRAKMCKNIGAKASSTFASCYLLAHRDGNQSSGLCHVNVLCPEFRATR